MLAQAVKQAHNSPVVIDLFADQDTTEVTQNIYPVTNLSLSTIRSTVECLLFIHKIDWVIYGSGLENEPDTLAYLETKFKVLGNSAALCRQFKETLFFFEQLSQLGIPYPEAQFHPPKNTKGWLIKPISHAGGIGITRCTRDAKADEYYQKFYAGVSGSVLFCSDGHDFDVIGIQRQWTRSQNDFTFSGIICDNILPADTLSIVKGWIKKIVRIYALKGLASLDFIWNGQVCYFLEINPRPPASMMLYPELDLLTAHVIGRLPQRKAKSTVCALHIIYARKPCRIKQFTWPLWSFDRPKINTQIQINQPICSIMAQEPTIQQTLDSLLEKSSFIENQLY